MYADMDSWVTSKEFAQLANAREEIFAEWLKALRSGDYTQGYYTLKESDCSYDDHYKWCCLGVLSDRIIKSPLSGKVFEWRQNPTGMWYCGHIGDDGNPVKDSKGMSFLSTWMGMALGLTAHGLLKGNFTGGHGLASSLTSLNDGAKSFKDIADIIERGEFVDFFDNPTEHLKDGQHPTDYGETG